MKPGIKVGPQDGIKILKQTKAQYCEVYFRLDWQKKYLPLFKFLNKKKINFGLHYWDMIDGQYLPNLLYYGGDLAQKTLQSIKETIDIAGDWNAYYVNFHPESYRRNRLDLDKKTVETIYPNSQLNKKQSFQQLLTLLKELNLYAKSKNVVPFLETVPKYVVSDFGDFDKGRLNPQPSEGMETEKFFDLARTGQLICLDIGHTLTQLLTNNREKLFKYLIATAKKLKSNIGLIHVTTNRPPFDQGVDTHNGILEKDFNQKVIPNKAQLIELLKIFKNTDTWLIPEPQLEDMTDNHYALKKLVKKIDKTN
jgi:hypothetical protein